MTTYTVTPQLHREAVRTLDSKPVDPKEESADYSMSRFTVEYPLAKATFVDDDKKVVTKAKPGDRLVLTSKTSALVKNRIVHVEVPAKLYECGAPTFKRIYRHGDTMFAPVVWECHKPLDLSTLPFLCEVYIVSEHVK